MKKLSRRKLVKKINELRNFIIDCEAAELKQYYQTLNSELKPTYWVRGNTFKFVKDYINSNFRPLV